MRGEGEEKETEAVGGGGKPALHFTNLSACFRSHISGSSASATPYWQTVKFIVAQFDGLIAGYAATAPASQVLHYINTEL